ncbi:hypothetical protein TruAng_003002 [Truncatella angustata]|nr:hypothetical protein TruAng_003002 [Truncatella angustata]
MPWINEGGVRQIISNGVDTLFVANLSAALLLTPADGGQDGKPLRLPQTIAHRGYKVAFPENSMAAFRSAVEVGAHAIETDLHLSSDGVVVLSHDASLKRCFGEDKKIADCDWNYLSTLRTVRKPRQPLPRFVDLLEYMAQPDQEHMWILLDVKKDDDPTELLSLITSTIAAVPAKRRWAERIIVGCWDANYVKLALDLLPGFPLTYIGWNLAYANSLFRVPNMSFNLLAQSVAGPCGDRFLRKARKNNRAVFVWTVNNENWMEWSIKKNLDGVITDDPKLFLEVCDRWKGNPDKPSIHNKRQPRVSQRVRWKVRQVIEVAIFYVLLSLYYMKLLALGNANSKQHVKRALGY